MAITVSVSGANVETLPDCGVPVPEGRLVVRESKLVDVVLVIWGPASDNCVPARCVKANACVAVIANWSLDGPLENKFTSAQMTMTPANRINIPIISN